MTQPDGKTPDDQKPRENRSDRDAVEGTSRPHRSDAVAGGSNSPSALQGADPVLRERHQTRFSALRSRPHPSARVALVIIDAKGRSRLFEPHARPTAGELFWAGAGTVYEVDTGLRHTTIEFDLPSKGDTYAFHAKASVRWRVTDPMLVVQDAVRDIREVLTAPLEEVLGTVTRRFPAEAVAEAEIAALDEARRHDVGSVYGLRTSVYLRLTMNATSVRQRTSIDEIGHRIELEDRTHRLRVLQERNSDDVLGARVDRYRVLLAEGELAQVALQVAHNPDDVAKVVEILREERHENWRHATEFVSRLLESGVIERWEIDEQARVALQLLKDSVERFIRPPEHPPIPIPDQSRPADGKQ